MSGKGAKAVLSDAILSEGAARGVQTREQHLEGRLGAAGGSAASGGMAH